MSIVLCHIWLPISFQIAYVHFDNPLTSCSTLLYRVLQTEIYPEQINSNVVAVIRQSVGESSCLKPLLKLFQVKYTCSLVTGEKLWLEPRVFCSPCEHYSELPSHPVISPTTVHLNPARLHTSPGTLNSSTIFLWGNPRNFYILPRRTYRLNQLSTVFFLSWEPFEKGEKMWLDRDSNPGSFADRANTLSWATEPSGHITNIFSP